MPADQTVPTPPAPVTGQDPTVQHGGPHDVTAPQVQPGDEKTIVLGVPAAAVQHIPMPVVPVQAPPLQVQPQPEKWAGRVKVAGAAGPGQKKAAAPVAPTQKLARYADATPTAVAPRARPAQKPVQKPGQMPARGPRARKVSRRRGRRFFTALLALVLILAVPVVSAYVAYKLTSGENPFQWPPTMDLSRVF